LDVARPFQVTPIKVQCGRDERFVQARRVNAKNFFTELKRRNVYKVAIAYAVVAWLLMQVASQIFPFFQIPNWTVRLVVLLLIIGFPVALILAWAFDLTPEGIKRAEDVDVSKSITLSNLSKETPATRAIEKSIAVLPFENFSEDKAFTFFADGMHDEILNSLAKIGDLKVISRTSVMQYRNAQARNLPEIAQALNVAHVLEGSVRRSANRVRVSAQLINARDDTHVWVEKYERELADVFAIQSEIAQAIAESLQAKLTSREEQALAVKPTNNPEAYDAYLRGVAFESRSTYSPAAIKTAIDSYERALQLDPNFALAWARLSRVHALLYFIRADATAARRDAAKSTLDKAQKLEPNSPETQLALGYYQYRVLRDYELAKTTFKRVQKMLPGSSEVPVGIAFTTRRQGNWDESVAYWEQGLALDPRNVELLNEAASTYAALRQFPAALKLYDRALDIVPNDPDLMASKAGIYQAQGNLTQAAKALSEINTQTASWHAFGIKITQLRLERNHGEAIRLLQAWQASASGIENVFMQILLAFTQRLDGDTVGAKVTAEQVRDPLEALCKNQPAEALFAGGLSLANAVLGQKDSALKGAERAVVLLPSNKDRVSGPGFEEILALIQTTLGENSRAIPTLTRLLQTPYNSLLYFQIPITPAILRLDPLWGPLRADPAFQKLCEEKQH
jgi:TolB-like protein/Tfp pilus assembly protein PilF